MFISCKMPLPVPERLIQEVATTTRSDLHQPLVPLPSASTDTSPPSYLPTPQVTVPCGRPLDTTLQCAPQSSPTPNAQELPMAPLLTRQRLPANQSFTQMMRDDTLSAPSGLFVHPARKAPQVPSFVPPPKVHVSKFVSTINFLLDRWLR